MRYECYGLIWDSELSLPELAETAHSAVDVSIRLGTVSEPSENAWGRRNWISGDDQTVWVTVPDVARFAVTAGDSIVVEPAPDANLDELRLYLLGTALGAILTQRGLLVLHGNAVRFGDNVVVAVGHSGAGKSTLAGEMHRRGRDVFSDDVVAIDAEGFTIPGPPRLKLWRDAADMLGVGIDGSPRVRPQDDKYHIRIDGPALQRLPVVAVYVLEKHDGATTELVPVAGTSRMGLLLEHTYRRALMRTPAHRAAHLAGCAALAARSRLVRVLRPADSYRPELTADAIIADVDAHEN